VQGFKNKTRYVFAIISKEHRELIGEISLHYLDKNNNHAQLAYWIGEPFWNQGIATEAAIAAVKFGFEQLDADLIYADFHPDNHASKRVLEKTGMTFHTKNGDLLLYKITKNTVY